MRLLAMLPLWLVRCLCVDLRGWRRGGSTQLSLLRGGVGVQVAAGSYMVLEMNVWRMWRQMRGDELQRALDAVMRDARLARGGA